MAEQQKELQSLSDEFQKLQDGTQVYSHKIITLQARALTHADDRTPNHRRGKTEA